MNNLEYEFHLNRYKDLLAVPNEETKAGAMNRTLEDHQLSVRSELMNFTSQALATARKLTNPKAQQYMMYGVGRRLRMMVVSYCSVFDTVAPDRKEPLSVTEMATVSSDLNLIYINIRGVLDNYAWSIFHETGMSKTTKLTETQVGLFTRHFRNDTRIKPLKAIIDLNMGWNADLKSRRDPAAHRMPLYIPTAILNEAEAARHEAIWAERTEAIQKGQYERDTELADEQSKLGTFTPHFLHDPEGDPHPIYRTIPTDVGKTITIGRAIHDELFTPLLAR